MTNGKPPTIPTVEELKQFMTGEKGDTPDGDLTPEAFAAIQSQESGGARVESRVDA